MDGNLKVESRVGYGSVFTLKIDAGNAVFDRPESSAPKRPLQIESVSTSTPGKADLTGCQVLLCEDNVENRKLLEFLISNAGGEVLVAVNGRDGVAVALEQQIDIIVMDMHMPVMDGYTATRVLRSQGVDIPIAAVTAYAMDGVKEKSLAADCTHFVSKPFNPRDLMHTLKELIDAAAATSSPLS
jgi:CheY-like chemotaxis protein